MKKIANGIVKLRYFLTPLFVLLIVLCGILSTKVNINYDMLKYLDQSSQSTIALNKMVDEFGAVGQAQVMVDNVSVDEAEDIKTQLENIPGVNSVIFESSNSSYYTDSKALYKIFLDTGDFDQESYDTVDQIRSTLSHYDIKITGAVTVSQFLISAVDDDMRNILLVACSVIIVILFLTSTSWTEPIMFTVIVGGSILINMGTNIFLGEISFITKAICAIMQIALAMDYSIILLHAYNEQKSKGLKNLEAMKVALANSFKPVSSSSITTIAGLVALMFMSFSIGFDVGMVLAKGILISLLSVFIFMPGIMLIFSPLLEKTKHRSIFTVIKQKIDSKPHKHSYYKFQYKTRVIMPVIVTCLVAGGAVLNYNSKFSYQLEASSDPNASINVDTKEIEDTFGIQNSVVIMLPKGHYEEEKEIVDLVSNYEYNGEKVINSSEGLVTTGLYNYYTKDQVKVMFGLNDTLVNDLFTQMNIQDTVSLYDLLDYMVSNNYAVNYANGVQSTIDEKWTEAGPLFNKVTSDELSKGYSIPSQVTTSLYEAMGGEEKYTPCEAIVYIANNDYLTNYGIQLQQEIDQKAQALQALNLDTEAGMQQGQTVIAGYEATQDPSLLEAYTAYKTALKEISYAELFTTYPIFDETTAQNMFLGYGKDYQTETLYNYQVINFISKYQVAKAFGQQGQETINSKYQEIAPLLSDLSKNDIATTYGIDSETIDKMFAAYQATDTLKGYQVLGFISTYQVISETGKVMSNELNAQWATVCYGKSKFEGEHYSRLIFNLNMKISDEDSFKAINGLQKQLEDRYDEVYVICSSSTYSDIKDVFNSDLVKVNLISFFAILVIVAITFKSYFTPVLLTTLIQGSIWVTMGISTITQNYIFFVAYLVVMCIQMGATVDYGILLTTKYMDFRASHNKLDSIKLAMESALPTILTSGSILVIAAFIIGVVSKVAIISSLGLLLSRGCLISVLLIIFALPQFLILCDKLIEKTTWKTKFFHE